LNWSEERGRWVLTLALADPRYLIDVETVNAKTGLMKSYALSVNGRGAHLM